MLYQVLQFMMGIALGYIAYQAALFVVGYAIASTESARDCAKFLLSWTWAMVATVFCTYALVGPASAALIGFAIGHAITLSLIDVEETFEHNKDL